MIQKLWLFLGLYTFTHIIYSSYHTTKTPSDVTTITAVPSSKSRWAFKMHIVMNFRCRQNMFVLHCLNHYSVILQVLAKALCTYSESLCQYLENNWIYVQPHNAREFWFLSQFNFNAAFDAFLIKIGLFVVCRGKKTPTSLYFHYICIYET